MKPTPDATAETVEQRFRRLAAAWHEGTDYLSSMEEAERHPAYQEISGNKPPRQRLQLHRVGRRRYPPLVVAQPIRR